LKKMAPVVCQLLRRELRVGPQLRFPTEEMHTTRQDANDGIFRLTKR
jgi:hypothetical protein